MAVITKGTTFANGDQVTALKLNNLADDAAFASGAVDNVSTQLSSGAIIVKDGGIGTDKLEDDAVTGAKLSSGALSAAYPVGSIYMNAANSSNPATLFGFGTWVAFGAGRVLVGIDGNQSEFNSPGETGGAKTHTLTESEMPAHTHRPMNGSGGSETNPLGSNTGFSGMDSRTNFISATNLIEETGGGLAHNNLQPYIVVYMWRRTA